MRSLRLVLSLIAFVAGCTAAAGPSTTAPVATTQSPSSTVAPPAETTTPTTTTSTTTSTTTTSTTAAPSAGLVLFAVAEERARRVALFAKTDAPPCTSGERAPCGPFELAETIELPHRPHNMTAAGPVLWVTHPSEGSVTRIDLSGISVVTQRVGKEPHDVKLSPDGDLLYVADEDGRALIVADPATLEELNRVQLPAKPHDLALDVAGGVWITLIGDDRLGRFQSGTLELLSTGRSPHDLIVASDGRVWFSNWNSDVLSLYDPITGSVEDAPAGAVGPHHFAVGRDGAIWVSDNGGSAVVGFVGGGPTTIPVGPVPHHIAFSDDNAIVAVSGSGQAVLIDGSGVIGRFDLSEGLHGAAVARLP